MPLYHSYKVAENYAVQYQFRHYNYTLNLRIRDVAQSGSVLAWGARGRKFESCHPD